MTSKHCMPRVPDCKLVGKYRKIDGSCNNLNFPTWGMSNRDQQRYLPPQYHDGTLNDDQSKDMNTTGA